MAIAKKMQHPDEFKCLEFLGEIYIQKSKNSTKQSQKVAYKTRAQKLLTDALELVKKDFGQDSPYYTRINAQLTETQGA